MQPNRTSRESRAIKAVQRICPPSAPWVNRQASSQEMLAINAMLANREHHWRITFQAMYFLLSFTALISRLLIIMFSPAFFRFL